MKRIIFIVLAFALFAAGSRAQCNRSLAEHIRTVESVVNGDCSKPAVISLNTDDYVMISFDDFTHDYVRYLYKLEHCDADWNTSTDLFESDYMTGTNLSEPIDDYSQSMNTLTLYTHYSLQFPNKYVKPLISGNYRVSIYSDDNTNDPVAVAYFSVVDKQFGITAAVTTDTEIDYNESHQQVDLALKFGSVTVRNPDQEIKVKVLQNKRYDNEVSNPKSSFEDANGMKWQHCKDLIFDAGNEYHKFEVLNVHQPTMGVDKLGWYSPYYHAVLLTDRQRINYIYSEEQNGSYVIRNEDNVDNDFQSEYLIVHYTLNMPKVEGGDFYVNGQWTNDSFIPEYKMRYDETEQAYMAEILMKQGYYNYQYLFVPDGATTGSTMEAEGNFYQTENEYTVFVYAHLQGERYDKLLGYRDFRFVVTK